MILISKIKLLADANQREILKSTIIESNRACDWISEMAWNDKIFDQTSIRKSHYHICRRLFPKLSSQVIVYAIGKVTDAYKVNHNITCRFKPFGSIAYDARILSWNMADKIVSIWAIGGRLKIPFVCGEKQWQMLQFDRGQTNLVFRDGIFYLFVSVTIPETKVPPCKEWMGIDLGLVNLAQSSDGETFGDAKKISGLRDRRHRQRRRLQSKRTRPAKRVLRKLRKRESRMVSHENHKISKLIVDVAKRTGRGIALENLKGIRGRIRASKKQRRILHSWAFADLQSKIEYKCRLNGVAVQFVDPRNTSRECPACGSISKKNRPTRDKFACSSCGYTADADTNAASNIAGRAVIIQPYERCGVRDHVQSLA